MFRINLQRAGGVFGQLGAISVEERRGESPPKIRIVVEQTKTLLKGARSEGRIVLIEGEFSRDEESLAGRRRVALGVTKKVFQNETRLHSHKQRGLSRRGKEIPAIPSSENQASRSFVPAISRFRSPVPIRARLWAHSHST